MSRPTLDHIVPLKPNRPEQDRLNSLPYVQLWEDAIDFVESEQLMWGLITQAWPKRSVSN